jgi:hypothetical protein
VALSGASSLKQGTTDGLQSTQSDQASPVSTEGLMFWSDDSFSSNLPLCEMQSPAIEMLPPRLSCWAYITLG